MIQITVDDGLRTAWPEAALACIQFEGTVEPAPAGLSAALDAACARIQQDYTVAEIQTRTRIAQTRACCRALGKDAHRYRNSAESMCRRIVRGKGLYRINNVVDCNNLLSIQTGYSMGVYDLTQVQGAVRWCVSEAGAHYAGIGKEQVNIECLPVLADALGYFGNPNSDSTRCMVTEGRKPLLLCVYGFGGLQGLEDVLEQARQLFADYCSGTAFETQIL